MGKIDRILGKCNLPDRDEHNSRVFIDAAENIHFHYREHRIVFSKEEFFAFADAITQGMDGLIRLLESGYKEMSGWDTHIIGGSQTEKLPLDNPKKSAYFDNRLQIERQSEGYGDVIHFHFRDYRFVMRKYEAWKNFCLTVMEAWKNTKKEWFKE